MNRGVQLTVRPVAAGLLAAMLAVGVAAQPGDAPAPFRLVALDQNGVPAALAQVEQGTLVRLSATEFDRLVETAAKPEPAAALLTTRYRAKATLGAGEPRLTGTGEWIVRSPAAGAALRMPAAITPLRQAKWSDGRPAVLFKTPRVDQTRLVAPAAGDLALNLDWSARGFAEPGEVRFDLRLPPSPVAGLDLELPTGYVPVVSGDNVLLTGPTPADGGTTWRLSFGGSDRLPLVLRRVDEGKPRLFAKLIAWQRLTGTEGTASFDFQVDSAKGAFVDLVFDFDAKLTPKVVRANNLTEWTVLPGPGSTRRLSVRFSEPARSVKIEVAATFMLPLGQTPWVSPALTLREAVSRGERLQLSIAPPLRFREWRPGDYTLVKAEGGLDGSYLLDLEPAVVPADRVAGARPSLVVTRPADPTWKADQQAEWSVGPAGEDWLVRTAVAVSAGAVSAVSFRVPDGWALGRVEVNGVEATADVSGGQLSVDIGKTIRPGDAAEVTTRLRHRRDFRGDGLPFPDLMPIAAAGREGRLTVRVDAAFDAIPTDPPQDEARTATAPTSSTGSVFERSLTAEPLVGRLYCRPRTARPSAEVITDLWTGLHGSTARTTLTVRPGGGALSAVTVWTPHALSGPLTWHDALGRRAGRTVRSPAVEAARGLAGLAGRTVLSTVATIAVVQTSPGYGWSIQFPKPLTEPATLTTEYAFEALAGPSGPWVFGMPFVGTVRTPDAIGERIHRYGSGVALSDERPESKAATAFDGIKHVTTVNRDGRTEAAFRFRVRGYDGSPMPVQLPAGSGLLGVTLSGRRLQGVLGPNLVLPLPRAVDWTDVEIRYSGPNVGRALFVRPRVELPAVPFDTTAVRRVWHISPAWQVAVRAGLVAVPGTVSESVGLPLPDWRKLTTSEKAIDSGGVDGPGASLRSALRSLGPTGPVVLDTFALTWAGVALDSPIPSGDSLGAFLAARDLALVELDGTPALTTFALTQQFRADPAVARAVADASAFGHDASGRFHAIDRIPAASAASVPPEGWAVWLTDDPAASGPLLVRDDLLLPSAWGLSVLLFLATAAIRSRPRVRFGLVLLWSGAAVVGTVLGSQGIAEFSRPLLFGAIAAGLPWCCGFAATKVEEKASRRLELAGGAVTLILATGVYAAEPVAVVYQVAADNARPRTVLAPPRLLDQLRSATADRPAVAIINAGYEGTRAEAVCRFQARLHLWAFEEGPARLVLPLQGVKLREVRLDGAEAGGVTIAPDGFSVPVAGRGDHVLEVRFEVPIRTAGTDREVKLTVPEVPISRLKFDSPRAAPKPRVGSWRGAVRTTVVGDRDHLDVDLGTTSSLNLRWPADASGAPAPVRAREACVWHVGAGTARLDSLTELRVTGAGPSDIQFAVPASAEVLRVGVRTDLLATGGPAPRIQSWSLAPPAGGPERTLTVSFQSPLEGRAVVELEMYRTGPWIDRPVLSRPRLLKAADVESHVAIVTPDGAAVEVAGLVEQPAEGFLKGTWTTLGGAPVRPVRAYRVTGPAVITPSIRRQTFTAGAASELTWWVEGNRLLGRATTRVPGGAGLGFIEWRVSDGVQVTDVSGPRLFAWGQFGERVHVWFDRPVVDATIRWTALVARTTLAGETKIPLPDFGPTATTIVRVRPTGGLAVSGRGELLAPTSAGEVSWRTSGSGAGSLTVWPPQGAALPVETRIRGAAPELEAITTIDLSPLRRDRPHRLSVFIAAADRAVLNGPGLAVAEVPSEVGGRRWDVALPAGRTTQILTASVRRTDARWAVPKVTVRAGPAVAPDSMRTLWLETVDGSLIDVTGLTRTGPSTWRADTPNWDAAIVRRATEAGMTERTLTGVIEAARSGAGWAYRGRFELRSLDSMPTRVDLPTGSTGATACLDGEVHAVEGSTVVLPANSATRSAIFRWQTETPRWLAPRFVNASGDRVDGPIDWVVTVPPSFRSEGAIAGGAGPADEELFARGLRVRARAEAGAVPDVRLLPETHSWVQPALSLGLWVGFAVLLFWPSRFRPERVATLGALGAVGFGPAGAALWLVTGGAVLYRLASLGAGLRRRATPVPESVA